LILSFKVGLMRPCWYDSATKHKRLRLVPLQSISVFRWSVADYNNCRLEVLSFDIYTHLCEWRVLLTCMSGALTANHRVDHAGPCTPTEIDCSVYSLKPAMPTIVTSWIDSTYYVISTHKTASVRNKCSIKLHASASAELARYESEIINAASQHYARIDAAYCPLTFRPICLLWPKRLPISATTAEHLSLC